MKKRFLLLIVLVYANCLVAQDFRADLSLLAKKSTTHEAVGPSQKKKSFNPLTILYWGTVGFYQKQIAPQWGANCAFETTCSRFSKQLVSEYGLAKGFFLTLDRMGRCNKISFYETVPIRINPQNKIIDKVEFYQLP
jgi:uncharacterized protein